MLAYLTRLSRPQIALWCYLIWYLFVLLRCFEPTLSLWMNSLGISAIIGTGLYLSTAYCATGLTRLRRWQVFRLYLMPSGYARAPVMAFGLPVPADAAGAHRGSHCRDGRLGTGPTIPGPGQPRRLSLRLELSAWVRRSDNSS